MRTLLAPLILLSSLAVAGDGHYPYSEGVFRGFVNASYANAGKKNAGEFFKWMDKRATAEGWPRWGTWLQQQGNAIAKAKDKTKAQMQLASEMHRRIKRIIPNFNLDRGFEFHYTVSRGERQCYLQAVLIASMLQQAHQTAGVAMVSKNHHGNPTNNGHAVAMLKLANGRWIIVDASEAKPFAKQQGLMMAAEGGYMYVNPVFDADHSIIRFTRASNGKTVSGPNPLDIMFLQSQFEFYRGERAPGGMILTPVTNQGLAKAEKHLRKSVQLCSRNPLAVFWLGRVLERQKKTGEAVAMYSRAARIYTDAGWLPDGPRDALKRVAKK